MTRALHILPNGSMRRGPARGESCPPLHLSDPGATRSHPGEELSSLLLTGVTGFVGSVLLGELLERGHRCIALTRPPVRGRKNRLLGLLTDRGIDAGRLIDSGQLVVLGGSLPDELPRELPHPVGAVVHIAGSTRFRPDPSGDPCRTNADGTLHLLRWMDRHGIGAIHHVSTAYVFGDSPDHAPEAVTDIPPRFRNAYERSKWLGERHVWRWGQQPGRTATVYRPSIVVGDWETGYATQFSGPYIAFAALDAMRRSGRHRPDRPLRIAADRDADLNLIPVDYLAELMASIIEQPGGHGLVYNIVHPEPIPTSVLFEMVGRIFGVRCEHHGAPGAGAPAPMTPCERRFFAATRHLNAYLSRPHRFERTNTSQAERWISRSCPCWDEPAIGRLIDFARSRQWGVTP